MTMRYSCFWKGILSVNRTVESFTELLLTSFPSKEMSLATNPAQKARDTSSVLPHTAPVSFPHPCSFTKHVSSLALGLLSPMRTSKSSTGCTGFIICSGRSPENQREREGRVSWACLVLQASLFSIFPPALRLTNTTAGIQR